MKCPKCGGETDENKNYCPNCGAALKPEDNSSDDTLRLPDLSGVPLGVPENRRREAGGSARGKEGKGLKVTLIVCALAIAAALAVCAALLLSGGETGAGVPSEPETEQTPPDDGRDNPDYGDWEDEFSAEPEEETPDEAPDEEPPEVEAREVTEDDPGDAGEDEEPPADTDTENEKTENTGAENEGTENTDGEAEDGNADRPDGPQEPETGDAGE